MAVTRTFTLKQAIWNGETWNSENGGPLSITIAHTGTPVLSRTGSDRYPRRVSIQDRTCVVTIVLAEAKQIRPLAGISDIQGILFYDEDAEEVPFVIKTMRLYEVRPTQNRANPSESALTFIHQSAAGQESPIQNAP